MSSRAGGRPVTVKKGGRVVRSRGTRAAERRLNSVLRQAHASKVRKLFTNMGHRTFNPSTGLPRGGINASQLREALKRGKMTYHELVNPPTTRSAQRLVHVRSSKVEELGAQSNATKWRNYKTGGGASAKQPASWEASSPPAQRVIVNPPDKATLKSQSVARAAEGAKQPRLFENRTNWTRVAEAAKSTLGKLFKTTAVGTTGLGGYEAVGRIAHPETPTPVGDFLAEKVSAPFISTPGFGDDAPLGLIVNGTVVVDVPGLQHTPNVLREQFAKAVQQAVHEAGPGSSVIVTGGGGMQLNLSPGVGSPITGRAQSASGAIQTTARDAATRAALRSHMDPEVVAAWAHIIVEAIKAAELKGGAPFIEIGPPVPNTFGLAKAYSTVGTALSPIGPAVAEDLYHSGEVHDAVEHSVRTAAMSELRRRFFDQYKDETPSNQPAVSQSTSTQNARRGEGTTSEPTPRVGRPTEVGRVVRPERYEPAQMQGPLAGPLPETFRRTPPGRGVPDEVSGGVSPPPKPIHHDLSDTTKRKPPKRNVPPIGPKIGFELEVPSVEVIPGDEGGGRPDPDAMEECLETLCSFLRAKALGKKKVDLSPCGTMFNKETLELVKQLGAKLYARGRFYRMH